MPAKRPPTRKQLAARKKFVKMVRARAKAARAAKRNAGAKSVTRRVSRISAPSRKRATRRNARKAITIVKNGHRLHGAAAQAVINSRKKKNPKRRGTLLSSRKPASLKNGPKRVSSPLRRNRGFWSGHIKRAVGRRLHAPIRFGRRRKNSGTPAGIEAIQETFLGRGVRRSWEADAPQGTPRHVAALGELTCLETETETFDFEEGEAILGANARGDLFVVSDVAIEPDEDFGHIEEIRYVAKKDHIDGKKVEYYHKFGEEGGAQPKLKTDGDGMLHIVGGSYTIEAEGITD